MTNILLTTDHSGVTSLLIGLGGIAIFIGFWCFVLWTLSVVGGWKKIAKRYPRKNPPSGTKYGLEGLSMGLMSYNSCLTIHASSEGLDIAVWPIFKFGHQPIFLPWSELHNPVHKKLLWLKAVRIDVGTPKIARINFSAKVFQNCPNLQPGKN